MKYDGSLTLKMPVQKHILVCCEAIHNNWTTKAAIAAAAATTTRHNKF